MTDQDTLPNRPSDPLREKVEAVLAPTYELDEEIGRGGMGIVYRARDTRLRRTVAIKLLPPELAFRDDIRSRFLREAATAAQLSHPNIVPIYTVEEKDNLVFFIMGYVNGANLASNLRDNGVMNPGEVRKILREVAEALSYAHLRDVIHRDIKPDNIILDNETGRAMVTDFGIARAVHETTATRLTSTGVAIGTPAYMSPEQSAGDRDVDGRSDLYSLGVVGYQLLCGEPPFVAPNTPALLVKHLSEVPRPLNERCAVPDDLNAIIMRCLAKDPNDRFESAQELIVALDQGARSELAEWGRDLGYGARYGPSGGLEPLPSDRPGEMPETVLDANLERTQRRGVMGLPNAYAPAAQNATTRSMAGVGATTAAPMGPHEAVRWDADPVRKYRRRLVTFFAVNVVLVVLSVLGQNDFWWVSGIWSIWLAFGYSKLWEQGYDWRDVLRQPHDKLFADVVGEKIDDTRALFDVEARERVRSRMQNMQTRTGRRTGLLAPPTPGTTVDSNSATPVGAAQGPLSQTQRPASSTSTVQQSLTAELAAVLPLVQEASVVRNDIFRMYQELPESERTKLPDVTAPVNALFSRIEMLAAAESELGSINVPGLSEATETEIEELEAEANPFDEDRSERRIRRLVQLRRQRVSLRDIQTRYSEASQKLQRCVSTLRTIRLDLVRFRSGVMSADGITLIAEQAIQLGKEVDAMLYAQEELARVLNHR